MPIYIVHKDLRETLDMMQKKDETCLCLHILTKKKQFETTCMKDWAKRWSERNPKPSLFED